MQSLFPYLLLLKYFYPHFSHWRHTHRFHYFNYLSWSLDCLSFLRVRIPIWYLQTFLKSLDNNSSDPIHPGIFNCAILNMYVAIIIHTIYNIISISGSLKNISITIFPIEAMHIDSIILTYNVHVVWFPSSFFSTDLNLYWQKIRSYNNNYGYIGSNMTRDYTIRHQSKVSWKICLLNEPSYFRTIGLTERRTIAATDNRSDPRTIHVDQH